MDTSASPRIAILASGEGTTAEACIRAWAASGTVKVEFVICNNARAGIFKRVGNLNQELGLDIKTINISGGTHPAGADELVAPGAQTKAEEQAILEVLQTGNYDLVSLMGYMKRIGPELVQAFGWHSNYTSPYQAMMLNTHPGLLPETKGFYGRLVQAYVLDHKLPEAGQTLHIVSEDYDDGPIVAEHRIPVATDDTPDTLFARIQDVEKTNLPADIEHFIVNRRKFMEEG